MRRHRLFLVLPLLLIVLLSITGTVFWATRGDDPPAEVETAAVGPDVAPDPAPAAEDAVTFRGPETPDPVLWEEMARLVEEGLAERRRAEEAAAAYAVARRQDEAVATEAMRRWGGGQLLLAIPGIGVTASVAAMAYERDGRTPATPNTPWGVGWYTFSAFPGTGGNAVFSGHVDWYTGAPAVFGRLRSVSIGDAIYMVLADGTPVAYEVARTEWVNPNTANVAEIYGVTEGEAVTFITCGGTWNPVAKDYSHRLIVRAMRVR